MISKFLVAAGALVLVPIAAQAQTPTPAPTLAFEQAVFITCKEAHAMQPEARKALAYYLAEYSARYRGVTLPEDSRGTQVGYLVRGGCTLAPDAYLFTVIDRAIVAEASKLPKRP
jgi:hypothetical protein